ncbi:MAG: hypothetical protein ABJA94_02530 [Rhodoglobus sp.]
MLTERDPALLPGPTAGQLRDRATIALYVGVGFAIVGVVALVARIPVVATVALGVLFAAGYIAWLVIGGRSQAAMRREIAAGYSTTVDAAGYDLRHPVTGQLLRPSSEAPKKPGRVSFLLQNMRLRPDTWAAKQVDSGDSERQ